MKPIINLYDWQKFFIQSRARFEILNCARQAGKSFALALKHTLRAVERPRDLEVLLSKGERQSKELMEKCKMHARAMDVALADWQEDVYKVPDSDTEYQRLTIVFDNGSRIIGLPANPDTARGYTANIGLDEFAIHKNSRDIFTALFPSLTRGFSLTISSTPKGKQNKFYELWNNKKYEKHLVTIEDAVAQGLDLTDEDGQPCTVEDLRQAMGDDEAFEQEYMCRFLDEATAWLTYEMISEAEHEQCAELAAAGVGDVFAGIDIGRKRDLTVYISLKKLGDVKWMLRKVELSKTSFSDQRRALSAFIREDGCRRVAVDATGLGMQLAEELETEFGPMVEGITFTAANKEAIANETKRSFEDKLTRVFIDDKLREDLHRVKRVVTSTGNFRFDAERTEDGHADRFWALALAEHASCEPEGAQFIGVMPGGVDIYGKEARS